MLGYLQDQPWAPVADFQGIEDGRELVIELDIYDGTNNSNNLAICQGCFGGSSIQVLGSVE